jgi:hypothetical protein
LLLDNRKASVWLEANFLNGFIADIGNVGRLLICNQFYSNAHYGIKLQPKSSPSSKVNAEASPANRAKLIAFISGANIKHPHVDTQLRIERVFINRRPKRAGATG